MEGFLELGTVEVVALKSVDGLPVGLLEGCEEMLEFELGLVERFELR